ncbi:putative adenosylcobyric acid synthase [Mycobacterium kansasii]|uniref:Putative adenosylcobyric acid synthase n=1 Tax=Mycobacterium kansasii TaxID=1768 RepID=A0A1V3X0V4_MYCKA|nr:putative adenosylcobyric acid synthase [Mycobacterium kansasii]
MLTGLTQPLTGFENHRGGTVLGPRRRRWGRWSRVPATEPVTASTAWFRAAW